MNRVEDRFWSKVDKSGDCWIWTAATDGRGYGKLGVDKKPLRAHRLSYQFAFGDIPEGLCVLHKCDIPICVNPNHLFLGTQADNMLDKTRKGRQQRGIMHPSAKLSENDVLNIRKLSSDGIRNFILAKLFEVHFATVSDIVLRRTWRHI